jgi:hypothetical protein
MPRTILSAQKDTCEGEKLFECTREDFFIWLFSLGIAHVRAETDGHIIFVIYLRCEVDDAIRKILDPTITLVTDYRKIIVARETWRTLLQLLSDHKYNCRT